MNNDEIEPVRSAATAIAGAIINSFVVTHSIIITVIVAVSVLAVALSRVSEFATGLETAQGPGKVMKLGSDLRSDLRKSVLITVKSGVASRAGR